jgi:hypothetical protein
LFLKAGDALVAPRDIPHELRNSGNITNQYLLLFSPSGFEEFVMATALPAPDDAIAPTERQLHDEDPAIAVQNVHQLATDYGIIFCWLKDHAMQVPEIRRSSRVTYCLGVPTDAVVARIHDQVSGQPVIILAGILGEGTEAASEVVSNPAYLDAMLQKAPKNWDQLNLEAVIEANVIEGHPGPPTVVAVETW